MNTNKTTTLPAILEPDQIYHVLNGDYADTYITDNGGVAKFVGNTTMITEIALGLISAQSSFQVVADIPARDVLSPTSNAQVLVIDASVDTTVGTGGAMYAYDFANTAWLKVAEYESFDENISFNWTQITGGPTSTSAAIDAAVAASHTHANKPTLDKFTESTQGTPLFDGLCVSTLVTNNW